jgi:hypothetical protein
MAVVSLSLSVMRSCLDPGQSDGSTWAIVMSRGCLKARRPCNRPQTRSVVASGESEQCPKGLTPHASTAEAP